MKILPYVPSPHRPIGTRLYRLFHLLWLPTFTVLFFVSFLRYYRYDQKFFVLILAAEISLIAIYLVTVCKERINSLSDRTVYLVLAAVSVPMSVLLFLAGQSMWVTPFNDTGTVYYSVAEILRDGSISKEINEYTKTYWATNTSNHDYFLVYPFNTFLVFYELCYYRFLRLFTAVDLYDTSGCNAAILLNTLSIILTVIFGFLTAKKAKDNCTAFLFLTMSFPFVPYYLHVYKVYSDTLSLPYVTAALYFYVKGSQTDNGKKAVLDFVLTGLTLSMGILLKGSVAILLVAVVIYTLLRPVTLRHTFSALLSLLLTCVIVLNVWTLYKNNCSWIDTSEADKYELPTIHCFMMAASGGGGFKLEDLQYSLSFPTYEERRQADTEEFIRRVKSHGSVSGYIDYQVKKVAQVMADGLYAQEGHLQFTYKAAPWLIDWTLGKYRNIFYCYITTYITLFYISMLASAALGIFRKKHTISTLFNICIFGIFLFFSFFEFKSRYLLNYVPLFMLCYSFAVSECAELYTQYRGRHTGKQAAIG